MPAVWMLSLSQLKRKKLQNGLTALMILLSALMISASVSVISHTQNLFYGMHRSTNGSHQLLQLDQGLHDPVRVYDWWASQDGVQVSELMTYRIASKVWHGDTALTNAYAYVMKSPETPFPVDRLVFAQGEDTGRPEPGTVWISTAIAYPHGIEIGDKLKLELGAGVEMRVSGIVADIPFGAPFSTTTRIWMNGGDYDALPAAQTEDGTSSYMLSLRYDDYGEQSRYWERFEQALGSPYLETTTQFEEISSFYLIMGKVIGFLMIALGAVMLAVALYSIGFTVSDSVLSQYRIIGVLKSIGLTARRIVGIYLLQYGLLAVAAVVPGLIAGGYVSSLIVSGTTSYLRTGRTSGFIGEPGLMAAVGVAVLLLVLLSVLWASRRTRAIMPAQAIRYGMPETAGSRRGIGSALSGWFGFDRFPAGAAIGARHIGRSPGASLLTAVIAAVTSACLVLGYVLITSIASIGDSAGRWGYDNSDVAVIAIQQPEAADRQALTDAAAADSRVAAFGWSGDLIGVLDGEPSLNVYVTALDGSYDELGFAALEGRNPQSSNEIAVGVNAAKSLGKRPGDTVDVYLFGQPKKMLITGVYQAIANMSMSARMTADALTAVHPDYSSYSVAYLNLYDSSQADAVAEEYNDRFQPALSIVTQRELLDSVFTEAVGLLILPMILMGALFIGIASVIVYSTSRIQLRKDSMTFAVYKTIGMSSARIRVSLAASASVLAAIGALLGIFGGVWLMPGALEAVLGPYGIVELPLVLNWSGIAIAASLGIVPAALGSWLSSRMIAATSPRLLIVE